MGCHCGRPALALDRAAPAEPGSQGPLPSILRPPEIGVLLGAAWAASLGGELGDRPLRSSRAARRAALVLPLSIFMPGRLPFVTVLGRDTPRPSEGVPGACPCRVPRRGGDTGHTPVSGTRWDTLRTRGHVGHPPGISRPAVFRIGLDQLVRGLLRDVSVCDQVGDRGSDHRRLAGHQVAEDALGERPLLGQLLVTCCMQTYAGSCPRSRAGARGSPRETPHLGRRAPGRHTSAGRRSRAAH